MAPWSRKPKAEQPSNLSTTTSEDMNKEEVEVNQTTAVHDNGKAAPDSQMTVGDEVAVPTEELAVGEKMDKVKTSDTEDQIIYPTGIKLVLIMVALCLSVFLVALDQTIIATAIPKM